MRTYFTSFAVTCLCLLSSFNSAAQTNLIINGSFEGRNAIPKNQFDIGPNSSAYPFDDLQNWDSPINAPYPSNPNGYSVPATLLSTDATGMNNPSYYGASPHTGISALQLLQHDNAGDHNYDQFATQQLAQPLLAGHSYQVQFWAIRPTPSAQYHTKLACYITTANPTYDASQNSLIPSPASKVITSDDIQPSQGWTLVSGTIIIPSNENNNQWVTLGYDRSNQVYDPSLPNPFPASPAIDYIIDDVSLVDMGCATPAAPQLRPADWTCAIGSRGPVQVAIDNYNPNLTYTIATTNNITNSPPGIYSQTTPQGTTWYFQLRSSRAGATGQVTVTARSICGSTSSSSFAATSPVCDGTAPNAVAYPNPANESLTMPDGTDTAILYDSQGQEALRADKPGKVNIQHLPAGLYNLHTWHNGKATSQLIEVRH